MNNSLPPCIAFVDLPTEARILFFIYASAAMARFGIRPPTPTEIAQRLEALWNEHALRIEDLSDPDRLTALLQEHLPSAGKLKGPSSVGLTGCRGSR